MPFGLGETKPGHFREMLKIAWRNRDNLSYAWKVLTRGVCDGCALGTTGLRALGMVVPVGGILLLGGWAALFAYGLGLRGRSEP